MKPELTEEELKEMIAPLAEEQGFLIRYTPEVPAVWDEEKLGKWPEIEKAVEEELWAGLSFDLKSIVM